MPRYLSPRRRATLRLRQLEKWRAKKMDADKRAQLTAAVRDAASVTEVFEILGISPTSPEATYVEIVWEALC